MSLINKVILMYIASERILLAQLNPQSEYLGTQPVIAWLQTNNILYHPHLERDFINSILYKYLKTIYRSRKTTYANVEVGPGSFKQTYVKRPQEHLVTQFKKLLQLKEKMENKT